MLSATFHGIPRVCVTGAAVNFAPLWATEVVPEGAHVKLKLPGGQGNLLSGVLFLLLRGGDLAPEPGLDRVSSPEFPFQWKYHPLAGETRQEPILGEDRGLLQNERNVRSMSDI